MKQFVQFPGGLVVDVTNIAFVMRKGINEFIVVPKQTVVPQIPVLNGNEMDALLKYLDADKLVVEAPKEEPKIATA